MSLVDPTPEGEALFELLLQMPRLNRLVQSLILGDNPNWTISIWGLLCNIKVDGPRTVPQIARARGLARQRVQKIVDEADAAGLVNLRMNPDHERWRVGGLTGDGKPTSEQIDRGIRQSAQKIADNFDLRDLDTTLRVLYDLQESIGACRD